MTRITLHTGHSAPISIDIDPNGDAPIHLHLGDFAPAGVIAEKPQSLPGASLPTTVSKAKKGHWKAIIPALGAGLVAGMLIISGNSSSVPGLATGTVATQGRPALLPPLSGSPVDGVPDPSQGVSNGNVNAPGNGPSVTSRMMAARQALTQPPTVSYPGMEAAGANGKDGSAATAAVAPTAATAPTASTSGPKPAAQGSSPFGLEN